jgi:hypothetical protein
MYLYYISENFFSKDIGFLDSFVNFLPNFLLELDFASGYHSFLKIFFGFLAVNLINRFLSLMINSTRNLPKFKTKDELIKEFENGGLTFKIFCEFVYCIINLKKILIIHEIEAKGSPFFEKLSFNLKNSLSSIFMICIGLLLFSAIQSINFVQDIFNTNIMSFLAILVTSILIFVESFNDIKKNFELWIVDKIELEMEYKPA